MVVCRRRSTRPHDGALRFRTRLALLERHARPRWRGASRTMARRARRGTSRCGSPVTSSAGARLSSCSFWGSLQVMPVFEGSIVRRMAPSGTCRRTGSSLRLCGTLRTRPSRVGMVRRRSFFEGRLALAERLMRGWRVTPDPEGGLGGRAGVSSRVLRKFVVVGRAWAHPRRATAGGASGARATVRRIRLDLPPADLSSACASQKEVVIDTARPVDAGSAFVARPGIRVRPASGV